MFTFWQAISIFLYQRMKTFAFLLILFIGASQAQRRRIGFNCWWYPNAGRVYCIFARLDVFLSSLQAPRVAREVVCTHSSINNPNLFKTQVLNRLDELRKINVGYNNLRDLPEDFFHANPRLQEINLRNNKIEIIPANLFQHQRSLEKLDLSNNRLRTISEVAFINNIQLITLELWNNQLATLPQHLFRSQSNLEKLSLTRNKLESLHRTIFASTKSLKQLLLVRNKLKCLPSEVFDGLINIESINLGLNDLRNLPDELLSTNTKLRQIRFWANEIECIPKSFFDNTPKLVFVNFLIGNRGLPWQLRQLFSRHQSYNTVNDLRREVARRGNESCANHICEWDPQTGTLDCSYRNLKSTENIEDVCGEVRQIKLNGNALNNSSDVGNFLRNHPQVRKLELQDNEFEGELDGGMLKEAEFLSFVDLSSNHIDQLPPDLFHNNLLLQEVRVRRNFIRKLPVEIFKENDAIERVDLSNNRIDEVSDVMWERNIALTDVDLSMNNIKHLGRKIFEKNVKLRSIDVSENRLKGVLDLTSVKAEDLVMLSLRGNQLREVVYEENSSLHNYTTDISLSTNRLTQVPLELLRSAPQAKHLQLQSNEISFLPETTFSHNPRVESIDLSHNRLRHLPITLFHHNHQLERLLVDGNSLVDLPPQLLRNNKDLKSFSAVGNQLISIPVDLFWRNPNLEEVRLSNNHLGRAGLPGNLFAGSPRLNFVSFGGNSLTSLPESLFQGTPRLSQVYLQKNRLESIPRTTFEARQGLSDQSLISSVANAVETDSEQLEELLEENMLQNKYDRKLLSGLIKLDLRGNPTLGGAGMDELFSGQNVTKFFKLLPKNTP